MTHPVPISTEAEARGWIAALAESSELSMAKLDRLADLLTTENEYQNLVAGGSLQSIWQRHYADSAQLLQFVPRGTSNWIDLGSGAGFPGIVIAILLPDCAVTLVESRTRRIGWLQNVAVQLELSNVTVAGTRLELLAEAKFEVISARAFAPLDKLLGLSARFSTADTTWVLPKGRSAQQELQALTGWQHQFHVEQSLTDRDAGVIVGQLLKSKGRRA